MLETNLLRRGSIYYFRSRTPADLKAILKRTELWRSLQTSCPRVARRRCLLAKALAQQLYETVRRTPVITEQAVSSLVQEFYRRDLELDRVQRLYPVDKGMAEFLTHCRTSLLSELKRHLARGEFTLIMWATDDVIERHGLSFERDSPEYRNLCQGLMRAWIEATERYLERDQGFFGGEPRDPLVRPSVEQSSLAGPRGTVRCELSPDGQKPMKPLLECLLAEKRELRLILTLSCCRFE